MNDQEYYVYGLIDPDSGLPFYIGKGKDDRAYSHLKLNKDDIYNPRKRDYIASLLSENKKIEVFFYETELTSVEANNEEIRLIRKYGRKNFDPDGILLNLTKGGEGGDTSMFFTEESYKKMSRSKAGINNSMAKLTEEQVLEIFYSTESIDSLSKKFRISHGQIRGIKRKKNYKVITEKISDKPGISENLKPRVLLSNNEIREIFLEENTYQYFKEKYSVNPKVVKSIKTKKVFKKITENLGSAGHVKKYKLSNQDANDIFDSPLSFRELAKKYQVNIETIRNIKKGSTRKFYRDPY